MELNGKKALVTASARRIGRQIASSLADAGCDVAVHYRTSEADAITLVDQLNQAGTNAFAIRADLTCPDQIAEMFETVKQRFGKLDVLVNNASVYYPTPIEELTRSQLDEMLAANTTAPALCTKHAAALMQNGGTIINIIDAKLDRAKYPAYCASKAALAGLTKSTAIALADKNIRVNAVCPGVILWDENTPDEIKKLVLSQIPMKRTGRPQDIANAVTFLASQDYITAQTLNVDGGWNI